jgi:hypothetical protein
MVGIIISRYCESGKLFTVNVECYEECGSVFLFPGYDFDFSLKSSIYIRHQHQRRSFCTFLFF